MKIRTIFCLFIILCSLWGQKKVYPERWVYVSNSLASDDHLERFRSVAKTASEHGLTAIMFSSGFDKIDLQSAGYIARLKEAKKICDQYGLELIPSLFYTGYGSGVLAHDKNLAEGLHVKGALFVVKNGQAGFVPDSPAVVANGGFEEHDGNTFAGYQEQDKQAAKSFVDTAVFHSGKASLRLEGFGAEAEGRARVVQEIPVKPYRQYRLSCWVKTENVQPAVYFGIHVGTPDGRSVNQWEPRLTGSSEWKQLIAGFNSFGSERVKLDIGVFEAAKGATGKVWIDDVKVEELGLVNVVRRAGTPLTVKDEKSGVEYKEGRDFAWVVDPKLDFRWNHDGPAIAILKSGRIKDGARLRVSYYHGANIYDHQVPICVSEPKAYEIWKKQARIVHETLSPNKYMMAMDELRMGGSCETCKKRKMTMAQIVGDSTTRTYNIVKELNPKAEVYVWSDMYDPNHNARDKYYMVEGDLTGSWKYIPKDLKIVCWYYERRGLSLDFFSKLGYETLAGAYYDADDLENPKGWLKTLDATPGAIGIMYTTWQNKYKLLADFGDLVSKGK